MNPSRIDALRRSALQMRTLCTSSSSGNIPKKPPTPPPPPPPTTTPPEKPSKKSLSRARNEAIRAQKASTRPRHPNQTGPLNSQLGIEMFLDIGESAGARRTGRAWRSSELRLKSFSDLHKLWYILLKERNVLLTERAWCKTNGRYWTNGASNLYKVGRSMTRVKCVVAERITAIRKRRAAEAMERERQGLSIALDEKEEEGSMNKGQEDGNVEVETDTDKKRTIPTHRTPRRHPKKWPEVTKSGTPLYI